MLVVARQSINESKNVASSPKNAPSGPTESIRGLEAKEHKTNRREMLSQLTSIIEAKYLLYCLYLYLYHFIFVMELTNPQNKSQLMHL